MKTKVISTARKLSKIRSFFWSAFSRIWLEHRELLSDFSFLVQIRKNMDLTYKRISTLFSPGINACRTFKPMRISLHSVFTFKPKITFIRTYIKFNEP